MLRAAAGSRRRPIRPKAAGIHRHTSTLPQAAATLYHLLAHAEANAGRRADSLPTMIAITRPLRIAAAFDDRAAVEALFARHSPYPATAQYLPDGSDDTGEAKPPDAVWPWFRSTWALGGEPRVAGAEVILENPRFLAAA
jgi:hypothetical protein